MPRASTERGDRDRFRRLIDNSRSAGVTGRRVLAFVADNREMVLASSAAELASKIGTSDATIVRTIQAAGFDGLSDLKRAILASLAPVTTPADNMRRTLRELEKSTAAAIENVRLAHAEGLKQLNSASCREQIVQAVEVLNAAKRIAVFGIGPSAGLAAYAAVSLHRVGRASRTLSATGSMLADQLLDLRSGDALLILAYGRLYGEVSAVFEEAKTLQLPTVLITEANSTPLAALADTVVAIPRGRPEHIALHGATLVGLEAIILSLAAAEPERALHSLDRLSALRKAVVAPGAARRGK
jgi:DNA-binding MurR/RpiR family transcriptional regulator